MDIFMETKMSNKSYSPFKRAAGLASAIALGMAIYSPSYALNKVRVGSTVSPDADAVALCLAIDNGAFTKAGLDVQLQTFAQSNLKYDADKSGEQDIDINMGAINAAQLYSSGVPVVVLRAGTPADLWAVIARKDSKFTKPSDFRGQKYGVVSLSGVNYGATYLAFETDGVNLAKDVKVSTLPPSALVPALVKGEIAGATTFEPFLTAALKTGSVKVLFRPGAVYEQKYHHPLIALTIATNKNYLKNHREDVKKFMRVVEATRSTLAQHSAEAAVALVHHMPEAKMNVAAAKKLIDEYLPNAIKSENTPKFVGGVQQLYDQLLEAKQLKSPVKASDFWIDWTRL
ncbi:MAG: ABC transporter substrate-binding protein [Burkholderiaceae bacterium]|nr:MAG: ABC transporter substrate-binding protein [Burkholderiaceae bacterium]